MSLKPERELDAELQPVRQFEGFVDFDRVSIRYSNEADPALIGASFHIEPGEVVAVVGGNGSGKSTVLKLIAGLYQPQAGSIRIDGTDIRQIDPAMLRRAISYVPQNRQFFYGTVAQNLRLADPTAELEDLKLACELAGCLEDVEKLESGAGKWRRTGFDVRIGDAKGDQLPSSLLQQLALARGYLTGARILTLDEPGNGLDFDADQALCQAIEFLRGDTTIIMVTHRPSHIKLADKVIWLERGAVKAAGPTDAILSKLSGSSF